MKEFGFPIAFDRPNLAGHLGRAALRKGGQ